MFNRPIAIWGTDKEGAETYFKLERDGYKVDCFFDNKIDGEESFFLDKKVKKPDLHKVKGYFIFVACKYYTYQIITEQLESYGMNEIADFIFFDSYKKKVVLIHGNCHMEVLRHYLERTKNFKDRYCIYPNSVIQDNKRGYINDDLLKLCDVLIEQDIRNENRFGYKLCSEYINSQLSEEALKITIPNLFGLGGGFFPYHEDNDLNQYLRNGENKNGMFPKRIILIDDMLAKEYTETEIIEKMSKKDLVPKEEILSNFEKYLQKIRDREINLDVHVFEFIRQNYRDRQLFFDLGHPTNIVMEEIWRQVCNIMGIEPVLITPVEKMLDEYEEPILPCVKEALGLSYGGDCRIRKSDRSYRLSDEMNLSSYIKEYIWWKRKSENR